MVWEPVAEIIGELFETPSAAMLYCWRLRIISIFEINIVVYNKLTKKVVI
jgi:hypothetical protein